MNPSDKALCIAALIQTLYILRYYVLAPSVVGYFCIRAGLKELKEAEDKDVEEMFHAVYKICASLFLFAFPVVTVYMNIKEVI